MTRFLDVFDMEIATRGLSWCEGGCAHTKSHTRGFVMDADKTTVHLKSGMATRSSLHRGLHEIAHCILDESGMRRFEKEAQAEAWATARMRELGIVVPRKVAASGKRYVGRMKRWGNNIKKGRAK